MRLRSLTSSGRTHDLGLRIAWSEVAEDARFELARGCPQHAFQVCAPAFTSVRDSHDRDHWASADAREFRRMRLRMRLRLKREG